MRQLLNNRSNIPTTHQIFHDKDDMDQNDQIANDREMQQVRRQIEINLQNWTQATTRNQPQTQEVHRQKVIFLFMQWIQLLETNYDWEYSQEYFALFQQDWYEFLDWMTSDSDQHSQAEHDVIQCKRCFELKD